jgi:hypothetical protein
MMRLIIAKFKRGKNNKLTTNFIELSKDVLVTRYIEDLIEPRLKNMVVTEYFNMQSEDVNIEVLDKAKLKNLIKHIDEQLSLLFEFFRNSKDLKKKNEILNEIQDINSLNSLIRDYFYMSTNRKKRRDLFIYYS